MTTTPLHLSDEATAYLRALLEIDNGENAPSGVAEEIWAALGGSV